MDDGKQATRQHEARTSMEQRPTLLDLWRRHPEIQNSRMIEAPGIPYIKVVYAFCGRPTGRMILRVCGLCRGKGRGRNELRPYRWPDCLSPTKSLLQQGLELFAVELFLFHEGVGKFD